MFFSIIVPVYNVERYLNQCVDSILRQSYGDFELILVDDGSIDFSPSICDNYASRDNRVKVIHKSNAGLSDARNKGLSCATGDYVVFIDSDDFIEQQSLEMFRTAIIHYNYPDLLITTLISTYNDKEIIGDREIDSFFKKMPISKQRMIEWETYRSNDGAPAQKKICKRSFLKKNELCFSYGRLHEDIDWTAKLLYSSNSYGILSYPWYHHRLERDGQITGKIRLKNVTDVIEMGNYHYNFYLKNKNNDALRMTHFYFIRLYRILSNTRDFSKDDIVVVANYMKKNKKLYSFRMAPKLKYKFFSIMISIVGPFNFLKIIRLIKH